MATFLPHVKKPSRPRIKPANEPIYIRITQGRETAFYPIGVRISLKDWDFKKCCPKKGVPSADDINQLLLKEMFRARELETNLRLKGYFPSAQRLKYELGVGSAEDFYAYFQKRISDLKNDNPKLSITYQRTLDLLKDYRKSATFDDLTVTFIKDFNRFLREVKGKMNHTFSINYIAKINDWVRATINMAINEGITDIPNPYKRFKIKREFVESEYLSFEDFSRIESVKLVGKLAVARDFFLLAAYLSGMRANELLRAKKEDIEEKEGIAVLRQYVSKRESGRRRIKYSIIIPKAQAIINKYQGKFLLPYMETDRSIVGALAKINVALKDVARLAGVKAFSTKFARKTLINMLHSQHMPSSLIAQIVGHSNSQTTEKSYIGTNLDLQAKALREAFK